MAQFGAPVGPGTLAGFVADSGLRPRYPAVEIYRVAVDGDPGAPYFADTDRLARDRRRARGAAAPRRAAPAAGPAAAGSGADDRGRPRRRAAGARWSPSPTPRWPARPTTAASTNTRRRSGRPVTPGTPITGCPTIRSRAPTRCSARGTAAGSRVSSSSSDSTAMPDVAPATSPAAAIDGDSGNRVGVQRAAGRRRAVAAGGFRPPGDQRAPSPSHPARPPSAPRSAASRSRPPTAAPRCGSTSPASRSRRRCPTAKPRGCGSPPPAPTTGPPVCSSASPTCRSPSTTRPDSPTRSTCGTPCWCPGRRRARRSRAGTWDRNCSAGRAAPRRPTACAARRRWRWRRKSRSISAAP